MALQSFAWFLDEIVEHAEIFLSLFTVDMDAVLELQPPDTWNGFPLFQILNDFLLNDGEFLARAARRRSPDKFDRCLKC